MDYVLRKQKRGLSDIGMWCVWWDAKISDDKTQVFCFFHRCRPHEAKHRSHKIMRMNLFVPKDKLKPDKESIRGLNLAAVKPTNIQVTKT